MKDGTSVSIQLMLELELERTDLKILEGKLI